MLLKINLWDDMQSHLFIDAKLSSKKGAVTSYRSVCRFLVTHFSKVEFNRQNFSEYLLIRKLKGNSPQTLDNHLKMAKHIDIYLSIIDPERNDSLKITHSLKTKGPLNLRHSQ